MSRHHVIIGDGITAAAFLANVVARIGDTVTLIGPNVYRFGAGLTYLEHGTDQPWRLAYLLDQPNGAMGDGFVRWLERHWQTLYEEIALTQPYHIERWQPVLNEADLSRFDAPRAIYGRYVSERASEDMERLTGKGVTIRRITGLATQAARQGNRFRITLSTGEMILADSVDVATGGPANERFGPDSGPTAFTTLYGNETALFEALDAVPEVACIGASRQVLDLVQFLRSVRPDRGLTLRIIGSDSAEKLADDPAYQCLLREGRISEEPGVVTWVYAEAPGRVRVRLRRQDGMSQEFVLPLVVNTGGPGQHLALDLFVSGMIAEGWLRLNEDKTGIELGGDLEGEVPGLRYMSTAAMAIGGAKTDVCWLGLEALIQVMRARAAPQ